MKIRPVGAELFYADGRTDMETLIVVFRSFANAPTVVKVWNAYNLQPRNIYFVVFRHRGQFHSYIFSIIINSDSKSSSRNNKNNNGDDTQEEAVPPQVHSP